MRTRSERDSPFGRLLPIAGILVIGYVIVAVRVGVAFAVPGFIFLIGGTVGFLYSPMGRALTRSLEAEAGTDRPSVPPEMLAELDELRGRVAELEERQDFSERLLAQKNPESVR